MDAGLWRRTRSALLASMAVGALAAAGCGGSNDKSSSSSTGNAAAPAKTTAPANAGTQAVAGVPTIDELATSGSLESDPPTSSPAAAKGKSIWWVSCGLQIPDCSQPAEAAKEAAKQLGIDFHVADGKLNVGGGDVTAVRTALAAKPDLIIIHGIGCPIVRQPLVEAKQQGVKVMGVEALDCSDPPTNGAKLFTADMKYSKGAQTGLDYFRAWGKITADYMIAKTGGKAQYIANEGQEPLQKNVGIGFDAEVKAKCPNCKQLDKIEFNSADLVPNGPWVQELRTALTRYGSQATVVQVPFDVNVVGAGGNKALQDSGSKAMMIGGSGSAASYPLVAAGKYTAVTAAHDLTWMGWGAIDNANRALQGQPTVPEGVGFRPVDKDHNLPASGQPYVSPIDYKAAYKKIWAAAGS